MSILEKILSKIKNLKRNQDSTNQDYVTGYTSALSTVEGIIAETHDGWIPVEERLPEPYKPHEHDNSTSAMEERERFFTEGEPIYERT